MFEKWWKEHVLNSNLGNPEDDVESKDIKSWAREAWCEAAYRVGNPKCACCKRPLHTIYGKDKLMTKLVVVSRVTKISYTANDWQLFGMAGRAGVARKLNTAVKKAVQDNPTIRANFESQIRKSQMKYDSYGAADSEGNELVWHIANKVYGECE